MISFLPILQRKQEVMRFSSIVSPPFEKGILWSTTRTAPSFGLAPQYWQVKLSLLKTIKRIFNGVSLSRQFSSFLLGYLGSGSLPISLNALYIPPKYLLYEDIDGNPAILPISFPPTLRFFNWQASSNFDNKYCFDIFLLAIKRMCIGFFIRSQAVIIPT